MEKINNEYLNAIKGKLTKLIREELRLHKEIRAKITQPHGMNKVTELIKLESRLKIVKEEIDQELYNFQEAKILLRLINS